MKFGQLTPCRLGQVTTLERYGYSSPYQSCLGTVPAATTGQLLLSVVAAVAAVAVVHAAVGSIVAVAAAAAVVGRRSCWYRQLGGEAVLGVAAHGGQRSSDGLARRERRFLGKIKKSKMKNETVFKSKRHFHKKRKRCH